MTRRIPDLVLIKGAPGVGKSSTARELAGLVKSGACVEVDALRRMVTSVKWTDQAEHRKLLSLGVNVSCGFLRLGFSPVILVDTFSGNKIDAVIAAFRATIPDARVFVVALHASEGVLERRVLGREAGGFRDIRVSKRINRDVASAVRPFERVIETDEMTPGEVAVKVLNCMRGGAASGGRYSGGPRFGAFGQRGVPIRGDSR